MLPVAIAPLSQCGADATVFRDPIVNFAYGGRADFRGKHNALYNFLSAPGLSVNVKTEEAVFFAHHGVLTVNGTFLTEAHITSQLSPQRLATASFWASELDPTNFGWRVVNGTCAGRPFKFGFHGKKDCFALKMAMEYSSATFELGNWTVTVKGMPSCDTGHDCLIKGPAHRIDVGFTARGDTPARDFPHGLIGQSFATPGVVRNGKQDLYPFSGDYTTTAQAEGAIEGVASDYIVHSAFATEFAFSRFNAAKGGPASALGAKLTDVVEASSIDRVADAATEADRRRLSEAPCPPPSGPPPAPAQACCDPWPAGTRSEALSARTSDVGAGFLEIGNTYIGGCGTWGAGASQKRLTVCEAAAHCKTLDGCFGFDYYPNLNDGQGEAYYCKNVQNTFQGGRSGQLQSSHYYKLAGKVDCA